MLCGGIILYLIFSGASLKYIVPQYNLFVASAGFVCIIVGAITLWRAPIIYRSRSHEVLLVVGLIIGFMFPPYTLGMSVAPKSKVVAANIDESISPSAVINKVDDRENLTTDITEESSAKTKDIAKLEEKAGLKQTTTITASTPQERTSSKVGIDNEQRRITLTPDNYYYTVVELSKNYRKYDGYTIIMSGFVSRNAGYLHGGEFLLGREAMVCCAADIAPFGLVVQDRGGDFEDGTWWQIKGKVVNTHTGNPQPKIKIIQAKQIDPIEGYIYP